MIPPPTPTALPPATPYFDAFRGFTIWHVTDVPIQSWNMLGDGRYAIQLIIVIALVVAGAFILSRFLKQMTRRDSEK